MSVQSAPFEQILLSHAGTAEAKDSKTVRLHHFEVPPGVRTLAFSFDFQPRLASNKEHNAKLIEAALEQHARTRPDEGKRAHARDEGRKEVQSLFRNLNNLMNAVLIDPRGTWRGRWDRNPASEEEALLLSTDAAAKGFLPGEIIPGRWTIAVECHGVFGEPVRYEVKVAARGPLSAAQKQALAQTGEALPRPKRQRRGPGWYFGEMHSHTVHSDGKHELYDLARRGAELGIDFICLTDHNTTSGLIDSEDLPVTIVHGCELTTFHGHHPIYGLTDIVPWHVDGRVLPMTELAPAIRKQGGVVSVAHPFKMGDPVCTGCRMPEGLSPESFDLFEVWYRRWDQPESDNEAAYALWNDYWKKGRPITAVAARDWHGPSQEGPFPGPMAFTGVWAEDDSPRGILEGLRSGRVIMSGGPILEFSLEAGGRTARIGEGLKAGAATLRATVQRLEGEAELRVFLKGERIHSQPVRENGELTLPNVATKPGWYRTELWQGALPRALTNHVVLEA